MNTCILTGNLGNDPESFFTNDGKQIVSFSIAFRSIKEKTNWIKVTCFNKTAELAEKYLSKGSKIGVTGILDQDQWTTDNGDSRSVLKLIANSIEFIKTKKNNEEENINEDDSNKTPF